MLFTFPLSTVHKRIQSGEDVDAFYLFVGLAETMGRAYRSGEYEQEATTEH